FVRLAAELDEPVAAPANRALVEHAPDPGCHCRRLVAGAAREPLAREDEGETRGQRKEHTEGDRRNRLEHSVVSPFEREPDKRQYRESVDGKLVPDARQGDGEDDWPALVAPALQHSELRRRVDGCASRERLRESASG